MNTTAITGFTRAYVKSMRLYYSFITGIAGMVGLAYYQYVAHSSGRIALSDLERTVEIPTSAESTVLILLILFLGWGINQIINDYLGLEEDSINAPARPMVTGALHPQGAVLLSCLLMIGACVATWLLLEPLAVIPLVLGVGLNVVYEYAKGYGIWGNAIFGVMIASCAAFAFIAAGPSEASIFTPARLAMLAFVALLNALMTYYTYFKDYEGDLAAGKRTLIVQLGPERARYLSLAAAFLPLAVFLAAYFNLDAWPIALNSTFALLACLAVCMQVWTGYLFYRNPRGPMT
ncbi:MAG: UbiA family prenyltransferase, partial [Bacteroidota bacterium]|nr:UbiA family prenyltransferase [Bacteroidota bacterium]